MLDLIQSVALNVLNAAGYTDATVFCISILSPNILSYKTHTAPDYFSSIVCRCRWTEIDINISALGEVFSRDSAQTRSILQHHDSGDEGKDAAWGVNTDERPALIMHNQSHNTWQPSPLVTQRELSILQEKWEKTHGNGGQLCCLISMCRKSGGEGF